MRRPIRGVGLRADTRAHVGGQTLTAPADTAIAARQTEFISFAIGNDQYGVDIMAVREIKGWSEITHLPSNRNMCAACSTCAV